MSKKDQKFYMCVHAPCPFKTDKRKAIYTHLVRTHNERKEDYECEYCSTMFEIDTEIERHLHVHHPQQPFTYTCVSRIEKVINDCAKLGTDSKRSQTPAKSSADESPSTVKGSNEKKTPPKAENTSPISKPPYLKPNISMRTRASVNESLNNIAKHPKFADFDEQTTPEPEPINEYNYIADLNGVDDDQCDVTDEEEAVEIESDEDSPTYISKPSGLKIKLSLKKCRDSESRDVSSERSSSPPVLEPSLTNNVNETDSSELPDASPPDIARNHPVGSSAQVRIKDSKYYDKLEVYHHTDEFGRRCCPFCDYKTMKNTIRVHLSGIHKIHFVKCSLCDYKAAFPHQITQHGIKFHKTTNLNVIQLSKESRDKIIAQIKKPDTSASSASIIQRDSLNTTKPADDTGTGNPIIDDEDFNSEESYPTSADEAEPSTNQADDRVFKPPKCQTSKTDYYSIRVENGVYLYSCNLCTFQTPVRATIYTHKYRHEEKSYRCGYCDFTSAPRSNVVHHCRVKHKNLPINVVETDEPNPHDAIDTASTDVLTGSEISIKTEPGIQTRKDAASHKTGNSASDHNLRTDKSLQTIIKVPQFKRSITSDSYDANKSAEKTKRPQIEPDLPGSEYKLSLNKLYRINPSGSPKFMCELCSYACDTHPKMKHHLYRHRPQKYKCPYCDHRKYPRSYVVRHVRDTHRNKPVRVIDLSKGEEPEDILEYTNDGVDDTLDDTAEMDTLDDSQSEANLSSKGGATINAEADDVNTENEEVNALKNFAEKLNLRSVLSTDLNDDIFMQSPDVSPNFSDAVYTSTPLIESFINGQYQASDTPKSNSKNFEKKKSLKDYRVNYGNGPRYICNKCGYGTENYKTIHNHMYRHESQRYQCPYCGYRRSPKSFVENHIREVHKGHPVIVTELTVDQELSDTPIGSPRQCVNLKRKEPINDGLPEQLNTTVPTKVPKIEESSPKVPVKWPAPKPVSQIDMTPTHGPTSVKSKSGEDGLLSAAFSPVTSPPVFPTNPSIPQADIKNNTPNLISPTLASGSKTASASGNNSGRFVERNRTTFKTMYKCVFDPETCNHISKDKSKMKQHLFMHVEYKPWSCDYCEMTASQSSHIKNHVRAEHPGVIETSFKYKRHNYLEKHIESFLSKGLLTMPVNEYRAIMDMKGNTKSSKQLTFEKDEEGNFVLCPYCNYKTKSGGMTDHVKMKHMQPRFKCHWCDYKAFYRSEVRKHHRKEKSHCGLDFKTQELDLVQVMEGFKEKNGSNFGAAVNVSSESAASSIDPSLYIGEDDDDDDDIDKTSECSSSEGSSIGEYQDGYVEYTTEQLTEYCTNRQLKKEVDDDQENAVETDDKQALIESLNTEVGPDGSMKIVQKPQAENDSIEPQTTKNSKFKCGYCSFSAELRVKVKMHCSKKHSKRVCKIIDPSSKPEEDMIQKNVDLDASDWKGTKFEQDLRKAGISKLNLASLFPNSKRFKKSDSVQKGDTHTEFKKPLEPVSKNKVHERKSENAETKNKTSTENDYVQDTSKENSESQNIGKGILISDVRSLTKNESENNELNSNENASVAHEDKHDHALNAKSKIDIERESENKVDSDTVIVTKEHINTIKEIDLELTDSQKDGIEVNNDTKEEINVAKKDCEDTVDKAIDVNDKIDSTDKVRENDSIDADKPIDENLTNEHTFAIDGTVKENLEINEDISKKVGAREGGLGEENVYTNGETGDISDKEEENENDTLNDNGLLEDDVSQTWKFGNVKLDGTCDSTMEHTGSLIDHCNIKTSSKIDLPSNTSNTCALKEMCEES